MPRFFFAGVVLAISLSVALGQAPAPLNANALVQKIQGELSGPPSPDCVANPSVPHGETLGGHIDNSPIYPGAENSFTVYVPAQYDPAKPACLLVKLDGLDGNTVNTLDNLIASKEIPVIIAIGIPPGVVFKDAPVTPNRAPVRYDRSYEFDSVNDNFANYIVNEVLPAVAKMKTKDGRPVNISPDGNDHMAMGASTGGIGSFTLAWERPDQFRRIYDVIGTFVSMRGGHEYPALIRKTEPKPIRLFLEDGSVDAWNPLFGSWFDANQNMESALTFAGYDIAHAWGTHGHDGRPGAVIFPDVMRWMWRDYPAPIKAGVSRNSTLTEITIPGAAWQKIPQEFQSVTGLAADAKGDIECAQADGTSYQLGQDDKTTVTSGLGAKGITGLAYGPDGGLYATGSPSGGITLLPANGPSTLIGTEIHAHGITVTHDGTIYVTEPGEHSDMPSRVWLIKPNGDKQVVDEGLSSASGIAQSPDGAILYVAERTTKWIYTYVIQPDGTLIDKQAFDWLHLDDITSQSGAEDLAVDIHGNLYVATAMGIQICDLNGRVRAILPLPTPCGPVRSLCFGGPQFDELYVTDGTQIIKRKMKVPGLPAWAPRLAPIKGGAA